jgi:uncharacterized membrane protein YeaQ/YmgE (transglycosylase-associated protein family)
MWIAGTKFYRGVLKSSLPLQGIRDCCPPTTRRIGGFTLEFAGGMDMGIFSWIIFGLIAGFIGSKIVNRQGQGFWLDIALGIVGALVGGFLFDLFGASGVTGLNIYSMLVAVVGSVVVLVLYNVITGRRRV